MSVISVFSGIFCNEAAVVRHIVERTGHRLITDEMVLARASDLSRIHPGKIKKAFLSKTSIFNNFTHEKECSMAYLRLALSKFMATEAILISGYSGLLIPDTLDHAVRVCLTAKNKFRLNLAQQERQLSEKEAREVIINQDHCCSAWTDALFSIKDYKDPALYDMVLPMEKTDPAAASVRVEENLHQKGNCQTRDVKLLENDFLLTARIEVALTNAGHNVRVCVDNGQVVLTINKQVLMLSRLQEELTGIVGKISGVESVETIVRQENQPSYVYRKTNLDMPSKVLLVDDEKEFVQTLSERLQMRDMGAAVVYDGKSALELVRHDDPEVMIIDLKMPGINGMEVLQEVKQTRPEIEVIVLTGHGSEQDKKKCMSLGAFAYMQKPVDINQLSEMLKKAHEKIKTR